MSKKSTTRKPTENANRRADLGETAPSLSPQAVSLLKQVAHEKEADRDKRTLVSRFLRARESAWRCTQHFFPSFAQPFEGAESWAEWCGRCDLRAYADKWVREGIARLVAELKELELKVDGFELSWAVGDEVDTARDPMQSRIQYIRTQFLHLLHDEASADATSAVSRDVQAVLQKDQDGFRHYHFYFESVAYQLDNLIRGAEKGWSVSSVIGRSRTESAGSKPRPKAKRGRPAGSSTAEDARLANAWGQRLFHTLADFARNQDKSERDVRLALDRDRQRKRRAR
jgi:hypothetical protein